MLPLDLLRLSVPTILADEVAKEEDGEGERRCHRGSELKGHDGVELDGCWNAPDGDAHEGLTDDCCLMSALPLDFRWTRVTC